MDSNLLKSIGLSLFLFINTQLNENSTIKTEELNLDIISEKKFEDLCHSEKVAMVYQKILDNNILYPHIVLAQAMLESGNFKSKIFQENNNMFGMRMPERRCTVASGENKGYAVYDDWEKSIEDYKLYQSNVFKNTTLNEEGYFNWLKRRYAEHPEYINVLKKIINTNRV